MRETERISMEDDIFVDMEYYFPVLKWAVSRPPSSHASSPRGSSSQLWIQPPGLAPGPGYILGRSSLSPWFKTEHVIWAGLTTVKPRTSVCWFWAEKASFLSLSWPCISWGLEPLPHFAPETASPKAKPMPWGQLGQGRDGEMELEPRSECHTLLGVFQNEPMTFLLELGFLWFVIRSPPKVLMKCFTLNRIRRGFWFQV